MILLSLIMIANDNVYIFQKVNVNFEEQNENKIGLKCTPTPRTRRLESRFTGVYK